LGLVFKIAMAIHAMVDDIGGFRLRNTTGIHSPFLI
jgi:hypothetical protein